MQIIGRRVLIKTLKNENPLLAKTKLITKSKGDDDKQYEIGKVVAVGTGVGTSIGTVLPCECKVNDVVVFTKYSGFPIQQGTEELLILNELDILMVDREGELLVLDDKLLTNMIKKSNVSNGIIVSNKKEIETYSAKILTTGKGRILDNGTRDMMEIKKEDTVVYNYMKGIKIKYKGKEYFVFSRKDVLLIQ